MINPKRARDLEEDTAFLDNHRATKKLTRPSGFRSITEELIVNIFSHLDLESLLTCRAVCRKWKRIAVENSLWKKLLETQFRGERTFLLQSTDDDKHLLWQSLFKLHYNWKRGTCVIRDFALPDSLIKDDCSCGGRDRELNFAVHGKYLFTITGSSEVWVSAKDSPIISGAKIGSESFGCFSANRHVSALTASSAPIPNEHSPEPELQHSAHTSTVRLCIGFSDGSITILDINTDSIKHSADGKLEITNTLSHTPNEDNRRPVQRIASFNNIIASICKPCKLNVFSTSGDTIEHIHDLMSLLKYQFALNVGQSCLNDHWTTVTAVFCRPSITGWDIGMQELHMNESGSVMRSRTAYCPCDGRRAPSTIAYAYPYILSGNDENLLVSYKVDAASNELAIHKLDTLWGHCSGIGHVDISPSKRAVSVSRRGTEIRWWDLECSSSPSLGGINKDKGAKDDWGLGHNLSKILDFSDEVLLLHSLGSSAPPAITVYDFR